MIKISLLLFLLFFFPCLFVARAEDGNTLEQIPPASDPAILSSEPETLPQPVIVTIRNGDAVFFQEEMPLPEADTVDIIDTDGVLHTIDSHSILGLLVGADTLSDAWTLSSVQYYSSFGALYLECITPLDSEPLCDNWNYAVGSETPWTSIDTTILTGGETVGLYFGYTHNIACSASTITTDASLSVTATKYEYTNNTWIPLTEVHIGATQPNPDDTWNPLLVTSAPVDMYGTAELIFTTVGNYTVGIVEDYYFPSCTLSVTSPVTNTTDNNSGTRTDNETPQSDKEYFDVPLAIAYLSSLQEDNGSFADNAMYTDWAAIAYGAYGASNTQTNNIREYLSQTHEAFSLLTDNERRAMALLALDENPYTFSGVDYIEAITNQFDGTQFGSTSQINDDIFALIPLLHVGYDSDDDIIQTDTLFILSQQHDNGSWEESVDMTAAALQALLPIDEIPGVDTAVDKAESYIASRIDETGGWDSVFTTSWALQAMSLINNSLSESGGAPSLYLVMHQMSDGGMLPEDSPTEQRLWATSYAIPAALGLPWDDILDSVSQPQQSRTPTIEPDVEIESPVFTSTAETEQILDTVVEFASTPIFTNTLTSKVPPAPMLMQQQTRTSRTSLPPQVAMAARTTTSSSHTVPTSVLITLCASIAIFALYFRNKY